MNVKCDNCNSIFPKEYNTCPNCEHTEINDELVFEDFEKNNNMKKICKNCNTIFQYRASEYCSSECAFEDVEQIITNGN